MMSAGTPPIGIALAGCGSVGSALVRRLLTDGDALTARTGLRFELRHIIVRDLGKARGAVPAKLVTVDAAKAIADPAVKIFVELIGGTDRAKELTLAALAAGKDVVTANKALLAHHGAELFAAARRAGRCIAFEAAVAGGVPLIESVRRGLIANEIDAVYGILNGTCNFILTRMLDNHSSYKHALAEAQRLGYAEADPALDVDGIDSAHKLAILASIATRQACALNKIPVTGISDVDLIDLTAAVELGYACKLLAIARRHGGGLELSVRPTFIPRSHPLASVAGPFNAVSVYGSAVGHTLFYGRGAGGAPTASAVISDLVDVAIGNAGRTFAQLVVLPDQTPLPAYCSPGETASPHYMRINLRDLPGGIGRIATALGAEGVSIASILQREPPNVVGDVVPVIVTTHPGKHLAVEKALDIIAKLDAVVGKPVCIPMLDGDA